MPEAEGRALLDELIAFATQPRFVYAHRWRVGDLVIWDNRCTMHRGTKFDDRTYRRDLRRTTVQGAAPMLAIARLSRPSGVLVYLASPWAFRSRTRVLLR